MAERKDLVGKPKKICKNARPQATTELEEGQFRTAMEQRKREEERQYENILGAMSKQFVDIEGYQAHHSNAISALLQAGQDQRGANAMGGAGGGHYVEPAFVQERQREYGKRLAKAAHAIYLKHKDPSPEPVMSDSQKTDMEKALYGQVISDSDAMLISEVSARAQEALIDFKIELMDDVMVALDSSPQETDRQTDKSCNDPYCQTTHSRPSDAPSDQR